MKQTIQEMMTNGHIKVKEKDGVKSFTLKRKYQNQMWEYRTWSPITYYVITDDPNKRDLEMHKYVRGYVRHICRLLSPIVILFGGLPAMYNFLKECKKGFVCGADTITRGFYQMELDV